MAYNRDSEALREALHDHSVAGYPVDVPTFGAATIVRQGGTGPIAHRNTDTGVTQRGAPQPFFVVKLDHPMPFSKWADMQRISKDMLTPAEWDDLLENKKSGILLGDEAIRRLEAGESVSVWEAKYEAMYDGGQLDGDGNIIYANFFPGQVRIPTEKLKQNMLVDFSEGSEKSGTPGRYWGTIEDGKIALIELFSPQPYMEPPDAIAGAAIKMEFCSKYTYALGYGVAEAWEEQYGKLPPGEYPEGNEKIYYLKNAMPLSKIKKLCEKYEAQHCLWQALILNILPLYTDKGVFRPLPENVIQDDMVVSYDEE